jgi:basic amino acid/polyamine antiporter, APA family
MNDPALKRVLGLPAVIFIAVGMTIGGGVFVFTGIVLKIVGQGLPLTYALAVVPVFVSMLPLAMLGSALPATGGNYRYPSRMVSPGLAFVGIWIYALATFFGQIPLYALACATYVETIFPGIPRPLFALALVTFFFWINYRGVRLAAQVQGVLVVILIGALLYYTLAGAAAFHPEHLARPLEKGVANLVLGTALLTFTYLGANAVIELGGEIKNPGRTIPRAMLISLPIVALIYGGVALATVGALPLEALTGTEEPLVYVSRAICSRPGMLFFILGGAVLALTTTLNALFIFGTKSLLMVTADQLLPAALGRIHPRHGTPHILLALVWGLSAVGILARLSLETLACYACLGGLIIFFPTLLAALRAAKFYPDEVRQAAFRLQGFRLWACVLTGMGVIAFFSLVLLVDLKTPARVGGFLLFAASGWLYYYLRKRYLLRLGIDPADALKKRELRREPENTPV